MLGCSLRATSMDRGVHRVAAAQQRLVTPGDDGCQVAGIMEDNERHACLQESDDYAEMLFQIEKQAEELEEIAVFEKAVDVRYAFVAKHGRSSNTVEATDMAGLMQHGLGPKLLNARYVDSYVEGQTRSKQSRHRQKLPNRLMPSLLAARPVSRNEYIGNRKAMEAYWKEWNNLESKNVETLAERDIVSAEARRGGKEIHFGYLFGFMVEKGMSFIHISEPTR